MMMPIYVQIVVFFSQIYFFDKILDFEIHNIKTTSHTVGKVNKMMIKHVRKRIETLAVKDVYSSSKDIMFQEICIHHPEKKSEFYCFECNLLVCSYCKMIGNHSSGEYSYHKLIPILEAYKLVVDNINQVFFLQ
jgi:hypothetical protein